MQTTELTTIGRNDVHEGQTMQAIVQDRYGSADELRLDTVARPRPGDDEVLVCVHAAGVDRGTEHLMTGLPYLVRLVGYGLRKPKHRIPGLDVAGTVAAVGAEVDRFVVGDAVHGIADGSCAEYTVAPADKLAHIPEGLSFEQAAVASISGITALEGLTNVGAVQPGQRVLVLGAAGAVGSYAVQIAKSLGADVAGMTGPTTQEFVRSLGVQTVLDYTKDDLDAAGRHDLILDTAGRNPISRLRRALSDTGTLVIIGGEGGNRFTGGFGRQGRAIALSPFVSQRLTAFVSSEHFSSIERLDEYLASGDVVPVIGQRFTLADVPEAMRTMGAGAAHGKTAIIVRD